MVHIEHDGIVFHLSNLSEDRLALWALPGAFRPYFPRVFGNPVLIDFLLARGIDFTIPFRGWDFDVLSVTHLEAGELFLQSRDDLMRTLGVGEWIFADV